MKRRDLFKALPAATLLPTLEPVPRVTPSHPIAVFDSTNQIVYKAASWIVSGDRLAAPVRVSFVTTAFPHVSVYFA